MGAGSRSGRVHDTELRLTGVGIRQGGPAWSGPSCPCQAPTALERGQSGGHGPGPLSPLLVPLGTDKDRAISRRQRRAMSGSICRGGCSCDEARGKKTMAVHTPSPPTPDLETRPYFCWSHRIRKYGTMGRTHDSVFLPVLSRLSSADKRERKNCLRSRPQPRFIHSVFVSTEPRRGQTGGQQRRGRGLQEPGMLIGKIVLIRPSSPQTLGRGSRRCTGPHRQGGQLTARHRQRTRPAQYELRRTTRLLHERTQRFPPCARCLRRL